MKILLDATEIKLDRLFASIPVYIQRYLSAIPFEERQNYILLINPDCKSFFNIKYPGFQLISFKFRGWNKFWPFNPLYLYTLYKFNKFIDKEKFDTIFIPSDYPIYLQNKLKCKKVIVIHDLKGIKQSSDTVKNSIKSYMTYRMYKRHLESADEIIAISKYTQQDILTYYPQICESKVHVVYNSVTLSNKAKRPIALKEKKYILYVNTLYRYKNIKTLVKAYNIILNEIDYDLVVVGKYTEHWENELIPYIIKNKLDDRITHLQGLSNEELRYLYENASLFVTPSLNEGFGFTPIEAAICRCPVISSIEEALVDSTHGMLNYYYPAMDECALAKKIKSVILNPPSSDKLNEISSYFKMIFSPADQQKKISEILDGKKNEYKRFTHNFL